VTNFRHPWRSKGSAQALKVILRLRCTRQGIEEVDRMVRVKAIIAVLSDPVIGFRHEKTVDV